jgi:signal transduction histidine kinase
MIEPDHGPDATLRFDLAVQRSHVLVYATSMVTAFLGTILGVFDIRWHAAVPLWLGACLSFAIFSLLIHRRVNRRLVTLLWMSADILCVTLGVWVTGGASSPWFIWYSATASAVAFAAGKRAAYVISGLNAVAYLTLLLITGEATFFNNVFFVAVVRMAFLIGASSFFLAGVGNLQQKRRQVQLMEQAEKKKMVELLHLTAELDRRGKELVEANLRIQEANRLKSQFLANMSHELRTPMNSIIGFSEILVERLGDTVEPKHLKFLQHIRSSGQHLLGIINDVLDLSKIEAGRMEIYAERVEVREVTEHVCAMMRGMAPDTPPQFRIDIAPDVPPIETDLAKFKQVLFNLCSNAVKFSPPGSPITITARIDGRELRMSVHDEGIGIAAQHHELIFDEFRQVDGTVKREFGGTGLGLALVRRFVTLQGGQVGVESDLGAGSTFWFTLPLT